MSGFLNSERIQDSFEERFLNMFKKKLILLSLLLVTFNPLPVRELPSYTPNTPNVEAKQLDQRAKILSAYFASYNSPLQYQAAHFIDAADKYGVDWKLVPSIAGVESTFGKNSYGFNGWGWGIYGDQALNFKSWKDGIYTVTEGLKEDYISRGLTNPYTMNKRYAASPTWGWKVDYFMKDLDKFATKYEAKEPQAKISVLAKTAGSSAIIAK